MKQVLHRWLRSIGLLGPSILRLSVVIIAVLIQAPVRAQSTRSVLVLYTYNANMHVDRIWSEPIREVFGADIRNQLFEEYIDRDRLSVDDQSLAEALRKKYSGKKMDLIVSLGRIPVDFVKRWGEELWPGTPKICAAGDKRALMASLPPGMTGVFGSVDFAPTLDLALHLVPNTQRVFYVGGVDPYEETWRTLAKQDFKRFAGNVEINYLYDLPFAELLDQLGRLPDHSVVIYSAIFRDGSGHAHSPDQICPLIASASNAPVFGILDMYTGCGIVGGVVLDVRVLAEQTARLGLRVLEKGSTSGLPVQQIPSNQIVVDWRQLQRWRISEERVPSRAVVQFRIPSFWERYKWYVLSGLAIIATLVAIIMLLLIEMYKRKKSDLAVMNLSGRLIHAGEEERKRIARELHDDIAQRLSLVSIELDVLDREFADNNHSEQQGLQEPVQQLHDVITDVHNLSHQLHSNKLQHLGLEAAVKEVCRQLARQHHIEIEFSASNIPFPLHEDLALCFYRVTQEALSNSVKHSGSARVEVRLAACEGLLAMTLRDYGKGFDPSTSANGLGLATMRERMRLVNGRLLVNSRVGGGTEIAAHARLDRALTRTTAA